MNGTYELVMRGRASRNANFFGLAKLTVCSHVRSLGARVDVPRWMWKVTMPERAVTYEYMPPPPVESFLPDISFPRSSPLFHLLAAMRLPLPFQSIILSKTGHNAECNVLPPMPIDFKKKHADSVRAKTISHGKGAAPSVPILPVLFLVRPLRWKAQVICRSYGPADGCSPDIIILRRRSKLVT